LANLSPHTLVLYPGMPIAQVSFTALDRPCERPYGSAGLGSKYQGQSGPVVSQYWRNG
jgi:dCTP deaminase